MNQDQLWEPARRIELAFTRALRRVARELVRIARRYTDANDIIAAIRRYAETKAFMKFAKD